MPVTLKDIAKHAGVSSSLVSFYLGHPDTTRVAATTQKRIDEAVKALGYRRNEAARSLRSGKSRAIGMLLGAITQPHQAHLAQAMMNELKARGYRLLLGITNYDQHEEQQALGDMLAQQVDAIYYELFLDQTSEIAGRLAAEKYPILLHQKSSMFHSIYYDDTESFKDAVAEFRKAGCQKVALVESTCSERFDLFYEYAASQNLEAYRAVYPSYTALPGIFEQLAKERPDGIIFMEGINVSERMFRYYAGHKIDYRPCCMVQSGVLNTLTDYSNYLGAVNYCNHNFVKSACDKLIQMIEQPGEIGEQKIRTAFLPRTEWERRRIEIQPDWLDDWYWPQQW